MTKVCITCKEEKTLSEFHNHKRTKDGLRADCKICVSIQTNKYKQKNKDRLSAEKKEYYQKNKEKMFARMRKYYKANKEKINSQKKEYRQKNIQKRNLYQKNYMRNRTQSDPVFRLTQSLRSRVNGALKGKNKSASTVKLLGCHPEFAKAHIEAQFLLGMSWENYGEWHVDHITPCAVFNMEIEEHQHQCFHYTNLQPLWANQNLLKSDKITEWKHTHQACLERINSQTHEPQTIKNHSPTETKGTTVVLVV